MMTYDNDVDDDIFSYRDDDNDDDDAYDDDDNSGDDDDVERFTPLPPACTRTDSPY